MAAAPLVINIQQPSREILLYLIILEVEGHLGTPAKGLPRGITCDGEGATSLGLPHVLLIIVVLGGHNNSLSNKVGRVKTNTKLTNKVVAVLASIMELFKEFGCSRLGNSTQIGNQLLLSHTNTTIGNS